LHASVMLSISESVNFSIVRVIAVVVVFTGVLLVWSLYVCRYEQCSFFLFDKSAVLFDDRTTTETLAFL